MKSRKSKTARRLTDEERKALSIPGSAEQPRKHLPLNFLFGCSNRDLDEFELARLAEVSDLRKELHAILDRTIDAMCQAALAAWFKEQDRQTLKAALETKKAPMSGPSACYATASAPKTNWSLLRLFRPTGFVHPCRPATRIGPLPCSTRKEISPKGSALSARNRWTATASATVRNTWQWCANVPE